MALYEEQRDENDVLVGYTRTSDGTSIPMDIRNGDHRKVMAWIDLGNTPDPDPTVLAFAKDLKKEAYKREGVIRIKAQVPEWNDMTIIAFMASIWNMLGTPNASQTLAIDIYLYVRDTAIPNVNSKTTVGDVNAIDPAT